MRLRCIKFFACFFKIDSAFFICVLYHVFFCFSLKSKVEYLKKRWRYVHFGVITEPAAMKESCVFERTKVPDVTNIWVKY